MVSSYLKTVPKVSVALSTANEAVLFGDISTTSFFPGKPLGCYGDGGACFTDSDEWAALIDSYRMHGKGSSKYENVRIGMNSRLDTVQAAILQVKLKAFPDELAAVNRAAAEYSLRLSDLVKTPVVPAGFMSGWARYTVRLDNRSGRDGLQEYPQRERHSVDGFTIQCRCTVRLRTAPWICLRRIVRLPIGYARDSPVTADASVYVTG